MFSTEINFQMITAVFCICASRQAITLRSLPVTMYPTSQAADKLATLHKRAVEQDKVVKPFVFVEVDLFQPTWAVTVRVVCIACVSGIGCGCIVFADLCRRQCW